MNEPIACQVRRADLNDPRDTQAIVDMIAMYATDPLAGSVTLSDDVRRRLPEALRRTPGAVVFLAWSDASDTAEPIGVAVCFEGLATFTAKPKLNLHDLAVAPEARGQRVGRALMDAVLAEARRRGCCAATLEVHADNTVAKKLYESTGFRPSYEFWIRPLGDENSGVRP